MDNRPTSGYIPQYKVDISLFHTFRVIQLGKGLIIRPLKLDQFELEKKFYYHNSHFDDVKKYLNGVYPDTEEKAHKILGDFMFAIMIHKRFIFAICIEETNFPIGYVVCTSPSLTFQNSRRQVNDWSIDFWLNKDLHNQGIMTHALPFLLNYFSEFRIPNVVALIDKTNIPSIRVLQKLGFRQTNELEEKHFYLYRKDI